MARAVEYLIASGHRADDVWGYTIRQAIAYVKLASLREGKEKADYLSIMTLASRGEPRDIKDRHKELMGDL